MQELDGPCYTGRMLVRSALAIGYACLVVACGSSSAPAAGGGGKDASGDATAGDASGDDAGNGSEAAAPFWCPDSTSGNPMCTAHQWCIVPCSPNGGGPPKPPFCAADDSMATLEQACPGGRTIMDPIVKCQCP